HGDRAAGLLRRGPRLDPALVPGAVDDRELDLLDRHRLALADLQHARRLARRRAPPAGGVGAGGRAVQVGDRLPPLAPVDGVVAVRDQVVDRAAVVAERDDALHAARALLCELAVGQRLHELAVVVDAVRRRALGRVDTIDLQEAAELAHG